MQTSVGSSSCMGMHKELPQWSHLKTESLPAVKSLCSSGSSPTIGGRHGRLTTTRHSHEMAYQVRETLRLRWRLFCDEDCGKSTDISRLCEDSTTLRKPRSDKRILFCMGIIQVLKRFPARRAYFSGAAWVHYADCFSGAEAFSQCG